MVGKAEMIQMAPSGSIKLNRVFGSFASDCGRITPRVGSDVPEDSSNRWRDPLQRTWADPRARRIPGWRLTAIWTLPEGSGIHALPDGCFTQRAKRPPTAILLFAAHNPFATSSSICGAGPGLPLKTFSPRASRSAITSGGIRSIED